MHILLSNLCFSSIDRPVGMPKMEKVYLHNPSSEEISLISISATTAHFHASFFQNRVSAYILCFATLWLMASYFFFLIMLLQTM